MSDASSDFLENACIGNMQKEKMEWIIERVMLEILHDELNSRENKSQISVKMLHFNII